MLPRSTASAGLDYNSPMRTNPALTRFVAVSRATSAAPVFAQTTKTITIKG
jgi:hypothetical protein